MKWLLISFIGIQVLVDLAHSVTVFPFVHYGMFSESFQRPDSLAAYEITVDGRVLRAEDFRTYRWDMVQSPLAAIEKQTGTGDFAFDKERTAAGLGRIGLSGLYKTLEPNLNNDSLVTSRFPLWYKRYLGGLLGVSIRTLRVDKVWYRYTGGRLVLLKRENRI